VKKKKPEMMRNFPFLDKTGSAKWREFPKPGRKGEVQSKAGQIQLTREEKVTKSKRQELELVEIAARPQGSSKTKKKNRSSNRSEVHIRKTASARESAHFRQAGKRRVYNMEK